MTIKFKCSDIYPTRLHHVLRRRHLRRGRHVRRRRRRHRRRLHGLLLLLQVGRRPAVHPQRRRHGATGLVRGLLLVTLPTLTPPRGESQLPTRVAFSRGYSWRRRSRCRSPLLTKPLSPSSAMTISQALYTHQTTARALITWRWRTRLPLTFMSLQGDLLLLLYCFCAE